MITFGCCCWNKLLTKKATCWIAWDTLSCMMINFSFYKFFVVMDFISANDLFIYICLYIHLYIYDIYHISYMSYLLYIYIYIYIYHMYWFRPIIKTSLFSLMSILFLCWCLQWVTVLHIKLQTGTLYFQIETISMFNCYQSSLESQEDISYKKDLEKRFKNMRYWRHVKEHPKHLVQREMKKIKFTNINKEKIQRTYICC